VLTELRERLYRQELVEDTCADEGIDYSKPTKFIRATLKEAERLAADPINATVDEIANVIRALTHIRKCGWGAP